MTYELEPQINRMFLFSNDGGALAAVDISFGPIHVSAKLYRTANGYFLSLPSRHSEARDKWYEQVTISDLQLKARAQMKAVAEFERLQRESLVAV